MPRPRLDTPNYRLVPRGEVLYFRWWQDGARQRISTGAQGRRKAEVFLRVRLESQTERASRRVSSSTDAA
jgi:hypothetical protein